jgi:hypothetical protein
MSAAYIHAMRSLDVNQKRRYLRHSCELPDWLKLASRPIGRGPIEADEVRPH